MQKVVKTGLKGCMAGMSMGASVGIALALLILSTPSLPGSPPTHWLLGMYFVLLCAGVGIAILGTMGLFAGRDQTQSFTEMSRDFTKHGNPFTLYLYHIPRLIVRGLVWAVGMLPTLWKFTKSALILIHSDERLLCMFSSALGVAIAHLVGNNILIGAVTGGILGVLHFELISKRLLRVHMKNG